MNTYFTGEPWTITAAIEEDGAAQPLTGATVTGLVILPDDSQKVLGPVAAVITDPYASLVQVTFPSTGGITPGVYDTEFIVTIGGVPTTFPGDQILVRKGFAA